MRNLRQGTPFGHRYLIGGPFEQKRMKYRLHNPFFIYYVHQQWQIDVTYISQLQQYNDNISHLLIVMECFSRKIFVGSMKSKSSFDVL